MSRFILFTDIHSCADELSDLIDKVKLIKSDILVGFSDILDKGPKPRETMQIVRKLSYDYTIFPIIGNHCYKNFRFKNKMLKDPESAKKMGRYQELKFNFDSLTPSDWDFIGAAKPYFKGDNFIVVHGGIQPWYQNLPPNLRLDAMSKKELEFCSALWYTRFVSLETGRFVSLGSEKPEDKFWTEVYDGRYGHAFYGHQPFMVDAPIETLNTTGFDLGCCYGGYSVAITLDGSKKEYHLVKAREVYRQKDKENG